MQTKPVEDALLVRYLLGHLSEDEQVQVEDRAFADPEYLAALEAAEADLIDTYVRGELDAADRRNFESRFLNSPLRRNKVEFARAFARVAAESKLAPLAGRPSGWQSLLASFRDWNVGVQFAVAAAALVLMVGPVWLALENSGMRARMAQLEAQRQGSAAREEALRRELADAQKQSSGTTGAVSTPVMASLMLLPGLSRGEAARSELVVPAGAQLARIEIQLEGRDAAAFRRFRAELRTDGGGEVLTQGNLVGRRNAAGFSVALEVPVSGLDAGQYELTLKGIAGDRAEDIGFYYFRVRK